MKCFPVSFRMAACYCLIPLLLSVLAIPSIAWGQTEADTEVELAFWDSVKDSDNPAMLNAYLEQYPDGNFASLATIILESLADEDSSAEISFWQSVEDSEDPDLLQTYLANYPDGNFAVLAHIKLAELTGTAQTESEQQTSQSVETESQPATQETAAEAAARGACPVGMVQTYRGCEESTVATAGVQSQAAQAAAENLATARAVADAAGAEAQSARDASVKAAEAAKAAAAAAAEEAQAEAEEADATAAEEADATAARAACQQRLARLQRARDRDQRWQTCWRAIRDYSALVPANRRNEHLFTDPGGRCTNAPQLHLKPLPSPVAEFLLFAIGQSRLMTARAAHAGSEFRNAGGVVVNYRNADYECPM